MVMERSGVGPHILIVVVILTALTATPRHGAAQQAAVSEDVVARLFEAGLNGAAVMNELQGRCVDFRVDDPAVQQRLRAAGADDAFLEQLRGLCYTAPPGAADQQPSASPATRAPLTVTAGSAALRSVVIPGLGQFSSGRHLAGAFFLAAGGGALAAGLLSESVTVYCLAPTTGVCPHDQIAEEVSESKMTLGLAGFAAVAIASALEAYTGVNRINRSRTAAAAPGAQGRPQTATLALPKLTPTAAGVRLDLVRVHF